MKIRTGFVSNSSSSSFTVIFSKKPRCWQDVCAMMFPKGEKLFHHPYKDLYENVLERKDLSKKIRKEFKELMDGYPIEKVAKRVWSEIQSQKQNDYQEALRLIDADDGPEDIRLESAKLWTKYKGSGKRVNFYDEEGKYIEDVQPLGSITALAKMEKRGEITKEEMFERQRVLYAEWNKERKALDEKMLNNFLSQMKDGNVYYTFEFSDNETRFDCALEHGDVFKNMLHLMCGHH